MTLPVTPFIECPNCRKLLEIDCAQCPECREIIPEDYAVLSVATNVLNTVACNRAKDIRGSDRVVGLIVLGLSIALYLVDHWFFHKLYLFWICLLPSAGKLFVAGMWQLRFSRFTALGDAEFNRASQQVKQSAMLWTPTFVLQVLVIAVSSR
jgi:hypothetical protein